MNNTQPLPYFKAMSDDELRTSYRSYRTAVYNAGNLACSLTSPAARRRIAAPVGMNMKAIELIEAIARRRGVRL